MLASLVENTLDLLSKGGQANLIDALGTVQKFDVSLAQATTSSLEALQALSLGRKAGNKVTQMSR
jgi:hypothetical protein